MSFFEKVKNWFSGNTAPTTPSIDVPDIASDSGTQKILGTAPEPEGQTMAGGRRHRTRRHRKAKKTHKRRKHH